MGKLSTLIFLAILVFIGYASFGYYKTGYMYGLENSVFFKNKMGLSSKDFVRGGMVPKKFTCDGQDVSPSFEIKNVPPETKSLAMVMEDGTVDPKFTHWILYNISPETKQIKSQKYSDFFTMGQNDYKELSYKGPCPPEGEEHKYTFILYALNVNIDKIDLNRFLFDKAISAHVINTATHTGVYSKDVNAK